MAIWFDLQGYSSDSNRQPVALISNIILIPPSTRSKNDAITSITQVHFLKSTPLPLLTPVCNFEALLGASLISMNQQVLLRPGTPVL